MPQTEDELIAMLRDRTESAPASPVRGEQTAALGRRMLRRRRAARAALAAGAAGTVAVAALAMPAGTDDTVPGNTVPGNAVPVSVRLPAEVPLPVKAGHLFRDETLPLIESQQYEQMGTSVRVRFTALSTETIYNVRCSVPDSWLVVKLESPWSSASIGRCGPEDHAAQFDAQSSGPAWTGRTQTLEVWILPPDAEIDEKHALEPDAIEKAATHTGTRPGAWAIGIYDRRR